MQLSPASPSETDCRFDCASRACFNRFVYCCVDFCMNMRAKYIYFLYYFDFVTVFILLQAPSFMRGIVRFCIQAAEI